MNGRQRRSDGPNGLPLGARPPVVRARARRGHAALGARRRAGRGRGGPGQSPRCWVRCCATSSAGERRHGEENDEDSAAFCARGAAAAASRWSSTAWAPMPRWRWTRRRCPCGGSVMVVGLAGGTLPLAFGTFGTLPFEAQHHPPLLGQRDRARRGPRARADRPHPRARGALAARACSRGVPADARGLAQRAGRDHAQRLRPAGQTAPPTASMCRRVNAREPSM